VILLTEEPRRQEQPRKLEFIPLEDTDNDLESEEVILGSLPEVELPSLPPAPVRSRGRPARPLPSRNFSRQRPSIQLGRSRTPPPAPPTSPRTTPEALFQTSFQEPEQISLTPRPRAPSPPARPQPPRQRVVSPQDLAAALISAPASPPPRQRGRGSSSSSSSLPSSITSSQPEYEYEYYYEYLDDDDSGHSPDYDLVPLANKVQIMSDGLPQCYDVGVFPHPFSCKKFVNCYRNPGQKSIVGSIYQCPSYLAFDPVGGRCNWVNEIVCTNGQPASRL